MPAAQAATTIEDLHPDVLTQVLRLLDGPALAAAGSATAHLRALAADPRLWERLSVSAFPSLRHPRLRALLPSHRSFFSDAFPFPAPARAAAPSPSPPPAMLISAVDLFYRGEHVFSRVIETDTRDHWFLGSPFRVDALERKDPPPAMPSSSAPASTDDLTLSWVVIDPVRRRAVNLSSRRPLSVERHWYTGEIHVRFASVVGGGRFAAAVEVTCGEEEAQPREVSLTVQDVDGMCLNGKEIVAMLQGVLEGGRKGWGEEGEEEARRRYCAHVARKEERKERRARRERQLDMCCIVFGVSLFLVLLAFMALG